MCELKQIDVQLKSIDAEQKYCKRLYRKIIRHDDPEDIESVIENDHKLQVKICELQEKLDHVSEAIPDTMPDRRSIMEKIWSIYNSLDEFSRQSGNHISFLVVKSNEKTLRASKRGFVDQLAVFSIVLTVLTFVLDMTGVFAMKDSNFYFKA